MIGVLDACFIIDWSKYSNKSLIQELFDIIYIHEETLAQLKSEDSIQLISNLLSKDKLRIYPWSDLDEEKYAKLRDEISGDPRIPSLERPDLLCLIISHDINGILLSENTGIHRIVNFHPEYRKVEVWTAAEVIENLIYKGLIKISSPEDFLTFIKEYEDETRHKFKSERIIKCLERIRKWQGK